MRDRTLRAAALWIVVLSTLAGCTTTTQDYIYKTTMDMVRDLGDLEMKTVKAGEMDIAYLERPGSGDTVVLVHGYAGYKDHWSLFARNLPRNYRIIILDLPGHGDSTWGSDENYTLPHLTNLLEISLDALDLENFHLVGHSLGGYLSILYTYRNPERVISLGLFNPAAVFPQSPSDMQIALEKGINPLEVNSTEDFERYVAYGFYKRPLWPRSLWESMAREYRTKNVFYMKIWNNFWYDLVTLENELQEINQPVMILWGEEDRILDVSTIGVLSELISNEEIAVIPKCGHGSIMEKPRETAILYADFLDRRIMKGPRITSAGTM